LAHTKQKCRKIHKNTSAAKYIEKHWRIQNPWRIQKHWRLQNLWRISKPWRIQNLWMPKPWRMENIGAYINVGAQEN
jgi:hypothetical protein